MELSGSNFRIRHMRKMPLASCGLGKINGARMEKLGAFDVLFSTLNFANLQIFNF